MYTFKALLFLIALAYTSAEKLKIINGDEVVPHSLPYVVAVTAIIDEVSVRCGGSLITQSSVLTAASCIFGAKDVEVIAGAHNLDKDEDGQVVLQSNEIVIHQDYNNTNKHNDIAIIHLPSSIVLNEQINIVNLPTNDDNDYSNEVGVIAGWGKTVESDTNYSNVLRKVDATIIGYLTCDLAYLFSLSPSQICTSGSMGLAICLGDIGSPLVVDGVQVGIASFHSFLGCDSGFPSVYTRVTKYLSWIDANK